jgi:hypothetical protein
LRAAFRSHWLSEAESDACGREQSSDGTVAVASLIRTLVDKYTNLHDKNLSLPARAASSN